MKFLKFPDRTVPMRKRTTVTGLTDAGIGKLRVHWPLGNPPPCAIRRSVQPGVRSGEASQPSRFDIACAQVTMALTWSGMSAARDRIDQG